MLSPISSMVPDENKAEYKILYKKTPDGHETTANPTKHLIEYLESQGVIMPQDVLVKEEFRDASSDNTNNNYAVDTSNYNQQKQAINNTNIMQPNQTIQPNPNIVQSNTNSYNNIPNIYANNIPHQATITGINNNNVV